VIRVVIADDQALIRARLRAILEMENDLLVVGEASSGRQAVQQARDLAVDIVLMDIRMPEMDGIEATAKICANPALAGVRVLVLTTFETDEHMVARCVPGRADSWARAHDPKRSPRPFESSPGARRYYRLLRPARAHRTCPAGAGDLSGHRSRSGSRSDVRPPSML
jgi:CheY-like chemotaxis protein